MTNLYIVEALDGVVERQRTRLSTMNGIRRKSMAGEAL
jgi:hypothetical protein